MPRAPMKNLHLPLPDSVYSRLQTEAQRTGRPSTALAREAVEQWLAELHRSQLHEAILDYAREAGGTAEDLDSELEAAGVEHLLETERRRTAR
jgi:predicted DNA-binding protein